MSNNEKNLGYGVPPFETGENPYYDFSEAPMPQGGFPGGAPAGFPQGQAFSPQQQMPFPGAQQQMPFPGAQQPMPGMFPGQAPGMFPGQMPGMVPPPVPSGGPFQGTQAPPGFQEESYIENILRLNRGKMATVYMTFENNAQWNAKVFKGIIEAAGRDHIVISDPESGKRYLLLMIYLDYVTFDEELNYQYPFA